MSESEPTQLADGHSADQIDIVSSQAEQGNSIGSKKITLLVVGTFAGGGIHRYIEEQVGRLQATLAVSTYDMASPSLGGGWKRSLRGLIIGLAAMVRFPFRSRPDIVHVHTSHRFSFYRSAVYVLFVKYVWQLPVILHIHGSAFDEFLSTDSQLVAGIQRQVFGASDEILVLSDYWKELISTRADTDRVRVIPNAVDPSTYPIEQTGESLVESTLPAAEQHSGTTNSQPVPHVVFVSNLIERKGVNELVEALNELAATRSGEFRATIAGDGPLSDRVEQLATDHEEVSYLGYISEERKRSLLAAGSIYVLPTYAEGLPIAMLEGMAGENAVVSTTVGSIPEVISEDRGILVEPGDVEMLTEALETLLCTPERRLSMADNNRRAAETEFSWERILEELHAVYGTHIR